MTSLHTGLFHSEDAAVIAIQQLQKAGLTNDQISIVTMNMEEAETIEERTATTVEEMIQPEERRHGLLGLVIGGQPAPSSEIGTNTAFPYMAIGAITSQAEEGEPKSNDHMVNQLQKMGLSKQEAEEQIRYVEKGYILILVEDDVRDAQMFTDVLGREAPQD